MSSLAARYAVEAHVKCRCLCIEGVRVNGRRSRALALEALCVVARREGWGQTFQRVEWGPEGRQGCSMRAPERLF